ncbi:MAG: cation transporter [Clostridia bacterium]|nr:cation transporter [Clostridia bacterium]
MNEKTREQQITRTSVVGILANIMLVAFKAVVGLIAGSISVILDAVNNLTDAMSSVITIVGIKLSKRRPDKKHPFGYGRIEYFSAIIISIIVLLAGVTSLIESAKRIFSPTPADYSIISVIIISVAIIVKILLGFYVKKQGTKYNSDALSASGSDALFDAVISSSTLVGAIITMAFSISLDGIIGAIISLFIIKAGVEMLLKPVESMIGTRPDAEITKEIKSDICATDGVIGAYDLILHNYGPDYAIGSVHIEVDADMSARDIHKLIQEIQNKIMERFHVFLTVGLYAIDKKFSDQRHIIQKIATGHEGVIATHGIYFDIENRYLSFDILTDFTVHDREKLLSEVKSQVKTALPDYENISINFDTDFSN